MRRILLIVALLVAGMMTMVAVRVSRLRSANEPADTQFTRIEIPQGYTYGRAGFGRQLDVSPDGSKIVYVARINNETRRLILQTVGGQPAREISGTDGADDPSFSPDSRFIVFYSDEKIRKVNAETGEVNVLGEVPPTRGVAWLDETTLILGSAEGSLLRFDVSTGQSSPIAHPYGPVVPHLSPYLLPGNQAVLCTLSVGPLRNARIAITDLKTGEDKQLLDENAFSPRYLPTGHILFARGYDHELMAARFDGAKREVRGSPMRVLERRLSGLGSGGSTDYAISAAGTLVYTLRREDSFDNVLADIGNFSLTEIYLHPNWSEELKRLVP